MYIGEKNNDVHSIVESFEIYGDDIVNHVEGIYTLLIYDGCNLHIYQDVMNGAEIVYYSKIDERLYISNTLVGLYNISKKDFAVNEEAKVLFARYGFVPGNQTLIKDVYKIKPQHKLEVSNGEVLEKKIAYRFEKKSEQEAQKDWNPRLQRAISLNVKEKSGVSMPISGGYDSNYILHYLNSHSEEEMNLYSIGGHVGTDESECVRKIAKFYGKHHLRLSFTSNTMINDLPDIVWRLGGAMFERGIFLQYRLAKELSRNHEQYLICGECADQVMDLNFERDLNDSSVETCTGIRNTYDYASYVILKKSGIMLNSFDIKGLYPYTNQRFMDTAVSLCHLNKTTKAFHKSNCEKIFDKSLSKIIHKEGGSTSVVSMFESEEAAVKLCEWIEGTEFAKKLLSQTKILPGSGGSSKKQLLKKLFTEFFETMKKVKARFMAHSLNTLLPSFKKRERRISNMLVILYLMLFEELYCSQRSAGYFEKGIEAFDLKGFLQNM